MPARHLADSGSGHVRVQESTIKHHSYHKTRFSQKMPFGNWAKSNSTLIANDNYSIKLQSQGVLPITMCDTNQQSDELIPIDSSESEDRYCFSIAIWTKDKPYH